jgi:HEAT repeat protein
MLLMLAISLLWSGAARPQGPDGDPVEQLRRALQASYPNATARDRTVKQCLAGLRSLSDLQRAAALLEWRDAPADEAAAAVDRANQAAVVEWFTAAARQALRQDDPPTVAATIDLLAQMASLARSNDEPPLLVRPFAPELADRVIQGPPRLAMAAARVLGQIEPDASVAVPALGHLLQADDAGLRQTAADALANLIQNALRAVGEPGTIVRRPAPRSELVLMAGSVLPAIHPGLEDTSVEVRRSCMTTIGLAATALVRLIEDPPADEASSTQRPLEAEREELQPLIAALRDQGPMLMCCLHDGDAKMRVRTHKVLEELGHARLRWRRRCAAAGARMDRSEEDLLGDVLREAVPGLAEALEHADAPVRRSAMDALEMLGPLALPALPALVHTLHEPDRFLRWSAVRTLGKLGPPAARWAVPDLTRLLQDPDADLRQSAASALARLTAAPAAASGAAAPEALLRALEDEDAGVRAVALHTLRGLKVDASPILPVLLRALSDSDAHVRQAAAETLGAFGPNARVAVDKLRLSLKDPDADVRRAAGAALLHIVPVSPR